jgi:hypothetical protein
MQGIAATAKADALKVGGAEKDTSEDFADGTGGRDAGAGWGAGAGCG